MILDKLSQSTYKRVEDEKKQNPLEEVKAKALAMEKGNFEFEKALKSGDITFICEVKKASPSKGIIAEDFPYVQIAKEYADDADTFSKKIYDVIGSGVGIIESVPAAISIAYYTQDPNECCLMCANLGGDTDTIGAMATAICGAFTGYSKINPEYTELLRVQNSETDFDEYINILKKGRKLAGCGR